MTKEAWAHNEWLRMYIEKPDEFRDLMCSVREFLGETKAGEPPTYGERCEAFMAELMARAPETAEERADDFQGFDPEW